MSNTAKAIQTVKPTVTTPKTALTVVKGTDSTAKIAEKSVEKPNTEQPAIASKQLSFAERKDRAERLYDLFERHGKLKEHANELLGIVRADESVNTSFKLNSSNGHVWQTTNQEFIKKTVKVMHEAILTKIEEVETEIELIQIG
ncbi:MAG: hypothetical protein U0X41_00020 [Chitinophagales bacterium]